MKYNSTNLVAVNHPSASVLMFFHRSIRCQTRIHVLSCGGRSNSRYLSSGGFMKLARPEKHNLGASVASRPTSPALSSPGVRPNTMILFPGDYRDLKPDSRNDNSNDEEQQLLDADKADTEALRAHYEQKAAADEAQRKKWLANAKPKDWQIEIDPRTGRSYGRGARKRAQARVWIQPGYGQVVVNDKEFTKYFNRMSDRDKILQPFVVTDTCGLFDVTARVRGGGLTGQAGAIQLGVARAMNAYNPHLYRPALKFQGLLTRDARKVERKKIGLVKARKAPQWVRR